MRLPFTKNRREYTRTHLDMPVTVYWGEDESKVARLLDLSAAGTLLLISERFEPHTMIRMGIHLPQSFQDAAGTDYLNFKLEVIEAIEHSATWWRHRCRNLSAPETEQFSKAEAIVNASEAQRGRSRS